MIPFSTSELQQRIRWYCKARWWYIVAIGGPGIVTLVIRFGLINYQVMQNLEIVTVAVVLNTFMYGATYWHPRWRPYFGTLAWLQIVFDIVFMTGAFFFNGGLETPIAMLYCIPILMSGAILGRRSIYITGLTATAIIATLSSLDFANILKPGNIAAPALHTNPDNFFPTLVITIAIILTITVMADFVGRLVRQRSLLAFELEAVNTEKAKIEAIVKTMGSALVALDTKGIITMVNDNFEYLTGWRRNEVLGKPFAEVLPMVDESGHHVVPEDRPTIQLSTLGDKGNYHTRSVSHYSYIRKDGSSFPFLSSLAPIVLDRRIIGLTNIFDDVTDVQKLEQLKTNFVALVSHQLKTPIGEIRGYTNNMLSGVTGELNSKQTDYLGHIREVAERCNKLITDLLDITILERGGLVLNSRPMRLSPALKQLVDIYRDRLTQKGLEIEIVKPQHELTVLADSDKLIEALGNVIANAIAYSKRGTITIETKPTKHDTAEIYISDEGSGMDEATLNALFDKDTVLSGAPTAEGGTGLGLYLARQLIYLQKGSIKVINTSKSGTTICITLPLVKG